LKIHNLATGFHVNADKNFLAAPQQIDDQGLIKGHSHVVIEKLDNIPQTETMDPQKFIFFKGLNDEAVNGKLTAEVTSGLPVGAYRLSSITTSANQFKMTVVQVQNLTLPCFSWLSCYYQQQASCKYLASNAAEPTIVPPQRAVTPTRRLAASTAVIDVLISLPNLPTGLLSLLSTEGS
jgi:hypothetical protein